MRQLGWMPRILPKYNSIEEARAHPAAPEQGFPGGLRWLPDGKHLTFVFDTFHDRRNGVQFTVNAIGGKQDGQFTNERNAARRRAAHPFPWR